MKPPIRRPSTAPVTASVPGVKSETSCTSLAAKRPPRVKSGWSGTYSPKGTSWILWYRRVSLPRRVEELRPDVDAAPRRSAARGRRCRRRGRSPRRRAASRSCAASAGFSSKRKGTADSGQTTRRAPASAACSVSWRCRPTFAEAYSGTHLSSWRTPPWTRPTVTRPVSATGCPICQLPQPQAAPTPRAAEARATRRARGLASARPRTRAGPTPAQTRKETPYTAVIEAIWAKGRRACWL